TRSINVAPEGLVGGAVDDRFRYYEGLIWIRIATIISYVRIGNCGPGATTDGDRIPVDGSTGVLPDKFSDKPCGTHHQRHLALRVHASQAVAIDQHIDRLTSGDLRAARERHPAVDKFGYIGVTRCMGWRDAERHPAR